MSNLYYAPYSFFAANEIIILNTMSSYHCIVVLRKKTNEIIFVTNGLGQIAEAQIINADKQKCTVKVLFIKEKETPKKKYALAISLLKNSDRLEWLFEKITEMGISEIFPLICSRTEKTGFKQERFEQIIISAMLQSQQSWLPILHPLKKLNDFLKEPCAYECKLLAHCENENDKKCFLDYLPKMIPSTLFFIGPEGDFTSSEISLAKQYNCQSISLGQNRLRTETAGLLVCSSFYSNFLN